MDYKKWVEVIKERDHDICQLCAESFKKEWLVAHHVLPVRLGGQNTLDNGETLCPPCHKKLHALLKLDYPPRHEKESVKVDQSLPPMEQRQLSGRELQIMRMISQGKEPMEIARLLDLSVKTISTFRTRILRKLTLRTTADIIRYAIVHKI